MASAPLSPSQPARPAADSWAFGPWIDGLLGYGGIYLVSLPLLFALGGVSGTSTWNPGLVLLFLFLANAPHYGATLVRVYADREDRRKYAIFAVWITLALIALLGFATHSVWLASWVVTAYVTWSPWHFSGQNYGLASMFLRRRGVEIDASTRRLFYASFVSSALLAITALHAGGANTVFAPSTMQVADAPHVFSPSLPHEIVAMAVAAFGLTTFGTLTLFFWRLRGAGLRALAPALGLVATQALWFTVPALVYESAQDPARTLVFASIWISTVHSVQYLWISAYYAKRATRGTPVASFLMKSFAAGSAVTALPALIFSPRLLGGLPWDVGLAAVAFSVVNLHHFILDGAIWKLRDGRVAQALLRSPAPTETGRASQPLEPVAMPWAKRVLWGALAVCVALPLYQHWAERQVLKERQVARRDALLGGLEWTGRSSVGLHVTLGRTYAKAGLVPLAREQFERANSLFPTAVAWRGIGAARLQGGAPRMAVEAFRAAATLEPESIDAHLGHAKALATLEKRAGEREALGPAIESLEKVLALDPKHREAASLLRALKKR